MVKDEPDPVLDEPDPVLDHLEEWMSDYSVQFLPGNNVCRWCMRDKTIDWSAAMFRAIALRDQRKVNILAKNEALSSVAPTFGPQHVAAAVRAGLDVTVLRNYGLFASPYELSFVTDPVVKEGLVACVQTGPSSIDNMQLLLDKRVKSCDTFEQCLQMVMCLVPEALDALFSGLRQGDPQCMAMFALLGPVLCDGGVVFTRVMEKETRGSTSEAQMKRFLGHPEELMYSDHYHKKDFKSLSQKLKWGLSMGRDEDLTNKDVAFNDRMCSYAIRVHMGVLEDKDHAILKTLLAEPMDGPYHAANFAIRAALEADCLPLVKTLVDVVGVPPSRGYLLDACALGRADAVVFLIQRSAVCDMEFVSPDLP
jgi:hypothetical protein